MVLNNIILALTLSVGFATVPAHATNVAASAATSLAASATSLNSMGNARQRKMQESLNILELRGRVEEQEKIIEEAKGSDDPALLKEAEKAPERIAVAKAELNSIYDAREKKLAAVQQENDKNQAFLNAIGDETGEYTRTLTGYGIPILVGVCIFIFVFMFIALYRGSKTHYPKPPQ